MDVFTPALQKLWFAKPAQPWEDPTLAQEEEQQAKNEALFLREETADAVHGPGHNGDALDEENEEEGGDGEIDNDDDENGVASDFEQDWAG
eukprot:TRINITY_DN3295_c0_g1_i1.p3 TRINITY_DN3295_c0_g1~~TRINITY_DN3295_c0_g1_i1.p3  ORF type:complete len:105 (+),score=29.05 TRINITY_DN3295_c0_g1_i1:45-317(+)